MKKILFILALFNVCPAGAQSVSKQYVDYSRVAGSFYYNITEKGVVHHININYALYPAPFYSSMRLALSTADDLALRANIVNHEGTVIIKWKPDALSYTYNKEFDISSLPAGKYHMDIYAENGTTKVYTIPFEKLSSK